MKAVLRFKLPEQKEQFEASYNGLNYKSAIWDFDQWLRSEMKYKELPEDVYKAYETCRKELRDILAQDNLSIEQ